MDTLLHELMAELRAKRHNVEQRIFEILRDALYTNGITLSDKSEETLMEFVVKHCIY